MGLNYNKLFNILAKLASSQTIDTIIHNTLPPLAENHIPKAEAIAIITPVIKYGDFMYSSTAIFPTSEKIGKKPTNSVSIA